MDLFLILTQFSYTICIHEKERSLHVTTQFNITINMASNMAAFGHISDTEVTFLEISAVIVIHVIIVKNILCELIITFFHRYLPDNISHISRVFFIIDFYTRAQKEYSSTNSIKCQKALMHITKIRQNIISADKSNSWVLIRHRYMYI